MAGITQQANQLTAPRWLGSFMLPEYLLPGGGRLDPAAFFAENDVVVVLTAARAAAAVQLDVAALTGAIPAGSTLYFGEAGELARLTADAPAGAVSLAVDPLGSAVENGDSARYMPGTQAVSVPSGTLVGRTYAERDARAAFGPAVDTDEEVYFTVFDVTDVRRNPDVELLMRSKHIVIKENYLPAFSGLAAALKAIIRAGWQTTIGWQ